MDLKKISGILSIASKAGKLTLGFDATKMAICRKCASLLIISNALSQRTKDTIIKIAQFHDVSYQIMDIKLEDFYYMLGKKVGVIAILDNGFANKISALIGEMADCPQ